jgi:hypothetical protein
MSIEQKIAELLAESKKLQEEQEDHKAAAAKHLAAAKQAKADSKDSKKTLRMSDKLNHMSNHHEAMGEHHVAMMDHFNSVGDKEQAEHHKAKAIAHQDKASNIEMKLDKMHEEAISKENYEVLSEEDKEQYTFDEESSKYIKNLIEEDLDDMEQEQTKEELTVDVSADVAALINGEELTEEFKTKAATIFEAAVVTRVKAEVAKIEEEFDTKLAEQVESIKEGLVEKVDGYLNYVVEQWMTDNELALENGMKTEIMESFVAGMKGLFEQHYIDVPAEKLDVLGDLQEEAESTKAKLDEQLAANVELTKQINEMKRVAEIAQFSGDMADTDAEKFKGLAEELAFEDAESFKTKLQTIKENYFGKKVSTTVESVVTDEPVLLDEEKRVDPVMAGYLKALAK